MQGSQPIVCVAIINKNNSPFYVKNLMEEDAEVSALELKMLVFSQLDTITAKCRLTHA